MITVKDSHSGNFEAYSLEETVAIVMKEIGKNMPEGAEQTFASFDMHFDIRQTVGGTDVVIPCSGEGFPHVCFTLPIVKS